ncbi:MAG: hypothetical protein AB1304_06110 [Bacteroidota bacterium]
MNNMSHQWIKILILLFSFFGVLKSQVDHDVLILKTTVYTREDAPNPGANVTVLQSGKTFSVTTSDAAGNVILKLPLNNDYTVIISKPGMLTKKFLVSTRGPQLGTDAKVSYQFEVEGIKIYPPMEGVDYSIFNQPLFQVTFDGKKSFDVDKRSVDMVQAQIEQVYKAEKEVEKKKKENEKKYFDIIKNADAAYAKNKLEEAKTLYTQALSIRPDEQYPKNQIALIDKALAELKAKQDAEAKAKAELEAKYNAAIKKGDEAFAKKDWNTAKAGYNEALSYKPQEKYPKDQLAAIEKAIADELAAKKKAEEEAKAKAELEAKYNAAIKKGDEAYAKKDWNTAKAAYNEALSYKPQEKYPKDQLAAIEKAIADELAAKKKAEEEAKAKAELEAKYNAAIKKGDEAFAKKDWNTAKAAYNEALSYKPQEKYPKDQLAAIEKAIADELAAKKKAEEESKAKAELEAKYNAAIKKGDDAFAKKDWNTAKAAYNEALTYKPQEKYPKDQLAAIEKAIADELAAKKKAEEESKAKAELEAKYNAAIKKGDDAFAKKDWNTAKAAYNEALTYKPQEKYPKDQLAAIEKAIADELAAKKKAEEESKAKAELEAKYNAAIKKGDDAFAKKDWNTAKAAYNEALTYKPQEKYPKDQLAAIEKAIADELAAKKKAEEESKAKAELEAKYNAAIKKGDDAFAKKDWNTAKSAYNEALTYKPQEKYPKDQLAAIEKAIADELAAKKKAEEESKAKAELEAKYNAAIKKGDDAFAKKDWNTAKAAYNEALTYKPQEKYPKDQLAAIEKAIADELAAKKKAEEESKAKAELEAKYNAAIKKGDDAFAKKDWNTAKSAYNEALTYKPQEKYPKDQLAAIEKAIADELAAKKKAEEEAKAKAELEAKYNAAIKKGDDAFAKKDWNTAKAAYNEALTYKPQEKYPKDQLAVIEKAIADELAAKKKAEEEAKAKAELEAKYNAAIKKGDDAFAKKDWNTAKSAYNEALGYKPQEKYPKDQLAAIEKAIADELAAKKKAEEESKAKAELEAKYNAAIKKGDDAFAKKDWNTAKAAYNEALTYKPQEKYPKDQLAAIEKAIADELAAKKKAEEESKAKAELEAKYNAAIKKGDDAFAKKDWNTAKSAYNEALTYKPQEKYPKDQLAAIEKAIADELAAKKKAEEESKAKAELEAKYNAAIKKGDDAFAKKDWNTAKAAYNEALTYKPQEKYPKDQLAAIEKAIADELAAKKKAEEESKAKAELEAKYNAAIKKGDDAFAKKDWNTAKSAYNEALTYKPQEKYPKDQLAAIEKAIAESKGVSIKNVETENKKIDTGKEKNVKPVLGSNEDKYKAVIKIADNYFNTKKYEDAKIKYEEAMVYKPSDPYAKQKLLEIEKLLNSDNPKGKKELSDRVKELIAKYPPGVTEKILVERDVTIYQRIVVKGDTAAYVYEKKVFGFGLTRYFRDGEPCTEAEFENETKLK